MRATAIDDPIALRRVISLLLLASVPRPDPTPLVHAIDPSRRDWLPWCWSTIEQALQAGPKRPGQLAELVYGAPVRENDRNALSQILLRCREKGLVTRIGWAWYALPGTLGASHQQGEIGDFARLLTERCPIGVTARQGARLLNVPTTRVHHWLMELRRDPTVAPRMRSRSARVRGLGNRTQFYWIEPEAAKRGRPRTVAKGYQADMVDG